MAFCGTITASCRSCSVNYKTLRCSALQMDTAAARPSTPFSLRVGLCPDDVEFVLAWCDARNRHFAEAKANFVQSLETWPGSSCWVPGLKWGLPWREAEDEELPILSQHDFMLFTAKDFGAFRATSFHDHGSFESCLQSTEPGDETPCSLQGLNCSNAGDNDVHGQRGGWAGFVPGLVPTEPCNDIFGEDDGQRGGWAGFAPGSVPTEPNDDVSRQWGGWAGCAPGLVPTEPCNDSFGEDDGQRGGWAGFAPVLCRRSPITMFPGNGEAGQAVRPVSCRRSLMPSVMEDVSPISSCPIPFLTLVAISWGGLCPTILRV